MAWSMELEAIIVCGRMNKISEDTHTYHDLTSS